MKLATGIVRPCNMMQGSSHHLVNSTQCSTTSITSQSQKLCTNLRISNSWNPKGNHNSGQSLASKAQKLRDKWTEFQGIKNWEGLLDPLDNNLRNEILRYGEFVEAAYRCFDFDTSSPGYATSLYPKNSMLEKCGFSSTGYKVTQSLHATCGVQVPQYCSERLPNWMSTQSSWIGYVAVCNDKNEIARLGRRDVVVAYRGTATSMEWLENFRATLTTLPSDMAPDNCESMVQSGFLSLYTSSTGSRPSLQETIRNEISKILHKYADEPLSITVTGHSLGAALATLTAHDITTNFKHAPLVTVVSFGGPRVGNRNFRCQLEKNGAKVLRIVNSDDPIPKVPGFVFEDNKEMARNGDVQMAAGLSKWLQKRVEDTQWVYAEIGNELRLSSKDCPQINNRNMATCHDLKTYLHLVDNFVSSNCPLRATAKRVLNRSQSTALVN